MSTRRLVRIALFGAILFVCQVSLSFLPNCELVSMLVIVLTLVFGKETILTTIVFSMLEVLIYGMGSWVIMYLYIWPLLVVITLILKSVVKENFVIWSIVSGSFGLIFGFLCALVYIPFGKSVFLGFWISGIPWDVVHAVGNFVVMITIGRTTYLSLRGIKNKLI